MSKNTSQTEQNVNTALSELLGTLGFDAMARDVMTETDKSKLNLYARIILKQTASEELRLKLRRNFLALGLL